ncbi:MAG: hypothetical protein P8Z00_12690 [Anaerolineales bacterium]|jgi:hypothetical protein
MTDNRRSNRNYDRPAVYEIILQGHLSNQWSHWFDGFMITLDERGRTILVGLITDQAALHGLLKKIRDLGVPLISVNRLDPDDTTNS